MDKKVIPFRRQKGATDSEKAASRGSRIIVRVGRQRYAISSQNHRRLAQNPVAVAETAGIRACLPRGPHSGISTVNRAFAAGVQPRRDHAAEIMVDSAAPMVVKARCAYYVLDQTRKAVETEEIEACVTELEPAAPQKPGGRM